ncbi:mitoguardin [Neocloeon triangulifer]|uniref:mitoguardin n=1 Tax=Neocloeon triangulifer TaxID=2078957 RepID=UPI00286F7C97|nr:mitoguardin [Neocloeon triangulifer]
MHMLAVKSVNGPWNNYRGVIVITVTTVAGIGLLRMLASYFKRRRPVTTDRSRPNYGASEQGAPSVISAASSRRAASLYRQMSTVGDRMSITVPGTALDSGDFRTGFGEEQLTPQQLGAMGMEAVETAINFWEDALEAYRNLSKENRGALAVTTAEEAEFTRDLQNLLDAAYKLQSDSELLFLDQRSVLFRTDSSVADSRRTRSRSSWSSKDSFVSAQDEIADLRDLEEFNDIPDLDSMPLYQSAWTQFQENNGIPYRCLRTDLVRCLSAEEYQCKLHCIRLAFKWLLQVPENQLWLVDTGRQVLADLMINADKDPRDFLIAYEDMIQYLAEESNWKDLEVEMNERDVKALTFFDIALDLILMDAFDDLDAPPSCVSSVVGNRWLSNGFKEAALSTALYSLLKAKRRMLQNPHGFMSHFYTISEHISPLMAWGFLGTNDELKETCKYFRNQVVGFLQDMFSFEKMRYFSVDTLGEDIFANMKIRVDELKVRLAPQQK